MAQARSAPAVHVARIGRHPSTLCVSRLQVPIDVRHRGLEALGNPDLRQVEGFVVKMALHVGPAILALVADELGLGRPEPTLRRYDRVRRQYCG